mmetsp:Transcript_19253/g.24997  ORF Transcript_19253/g.24997 Transcript_19253/m.24997 type:complete len:132 (-) Transcript_19253:143-538(-)
MCFRYPQILNFTVSDGRIFSQAKIIATNNFNKSSNTSDTTVENVGKFYLTNILPLGIGLVVLLVICVIVTFCREREDAVDLGLRHPVIVVDGSEEEDNNVEENEEDRSHAVHSNGLELGVLNGSNTSSDVV